MSRRECAFVHSFLFFPGIVRINLYAHTQNSAGVFN